MGESGYQTAVSTACYVIEGVGVTVLVLGMR